MIEINLLPGAQQQKRSRSAAFDFGAFFGGVVARIRDPFLIAAVASVIVSALATGGMWLIQNRQSAALTARQAKASQDSTRFKLVIAQRHAAEAQRDSLISQISVIRSVDGSRYVWPHILDEVSRALTPYTWITSLLQTSAVSALSPEVEAGIGAGDAKAKTALEARADSDAVRASRLGWRVVGQTIDIQALTRFLTQLEASPWIEDVTLVKTETVASPLANKDIIEFVLDMKLQRPDSSMIRKVPLVVSVK